MSAAGCLRAWLAQLRRCRQACLWVCWCLLPTIAGAAHHFDHRAYAGHPIHPPAAGLDPTRLSSYAQRFPLSVHPKVSLQRLPLPVRVLQGLQVDDYRDLRIFNGLGQPVPMALSTVPTDPGKRNEKALAIHPIASAPKTGGVAGVLLDARAIGEPAVGLSLDVELPRARPVRFTLEASTDLQDWRPLAETVMYRAGDGGDLGESRFDLGGGENLAGRYLRVSWPAGMPGGAVPKVRGAKVVTQAASESAESLRAEFRLPVAADPHTLVFSWPFATPVTAVDITPQAVDSVVPFVLFGREGSDRPWTRLAGAVAYRLQSAARSQVQTNGPLALPPGRWRDMRIEADPLTPGFVGVPRLNAIFEPVQVVFLANGPGPFVLAAGLASAPAAYLAMNALLPAYSPGQENDVPLARLDPSPQPGASPEAGRAAGAGISELAAPLPVRAAEPVSKTRSAILWLVLLAGAALLAAMAWVLMRQTAATGTSPPG